MKTLDKAAVIVASIGALNWGLVKFLSIDLLSYVPTGIFSTVVVAAIAASGIYVGYEAIQNKI